MRRLLRLRPGARGEGEINDPMAGAFGVKLFEAGVVQEWWEGDGGGGRKGVCWLIGC